MLIAVAIFFPCSIAYAFSDMEIKNPMERLDMVVEPVAIPPHYGPEEICEYFTPIEARLFVLWRENVLAISRPELMDSTDPDGEASMQNIENVVAKVLLPRTMPETISRVVTDAAYVRPVKRAIYTLRILADMSFLTSSDVSGSVALSPHVIEPTAIIMTFKMAIPRFKIAWESIKVISQEHLVSLPTLVDLLAKVGLEENSKWLNIIIGLTARRMFTPNPLETKF